MIEMKTCLAILLPQVSFRLAVPEDTITSDAQLTMIFYAHRIRTYFGSSHLSGSKFMIELESVFSFFNAYLAGNFATAAGQAVGTGLGPAGVVLLAVLWVLLVIVGCALLALAIANCICWCCFAGATLGFATGRQRPSNVPTAAVEAAALVGEATAFATARAAEAGRRRLQGYRVRDPALDA